MWAYYFLYLWDRLNLIGIQLAFWFPCVVSLCEFSVSLFVLLCNNTDLNYTWVPRDVIFCGFLANLDELLCNHICCNYVFFSVLMFWFNVNFENTFGVCSVITFITTIFDYIMLRILVRFQQLFLSYFIPKCLIWNGMNHLSNSFMLWLFVGSDTSIRCWFVVTNIYISLDWFSHGPTYDKIGLCCSWFSKFDNSTFLSIDFLMIRPTTSWHSGNLVFKM